MKAIRIVRPGEPDVLELTDLEEPIPGPGQVRVEVHGTALNRADLLQRRGAYPAPPGVPADIPGLEFSGVVEGVGEGVDESAVGSWVMGLVGGGGYAEMLVTEASHVVPMPRGLQFVECAAVPEAFCTAYDALVLQGGLQPGQTRRGSSVRPRLQSWRPWRSGACPSTFRSTIAGSPSVT